MMLSRGLVVCLSVVALLGLHNGLVECSEGEEEILVGSGNGSFSGDDVLTTHEPEEENKCQTEEEMFNSEIHIAKLKPDVANILAFAMFVIVVVVAKLIWHHRLMHLVSSSIPESCMLIVVGAHIGGIIVGSFYVNECNKDAPPPLRFTPNTFFLYLLPPIVLESGYFLDNRAFFGNLVTILVYAVIGTIWNAVAIGMTLLALYQGGAILTGENLQDVKFTIPSALLFGTICAAVDPVAVLSVFDEIHVKRLLHILVFGESLLNDAVTIVLFIVLGAFANRPFDPHTGPITPREVFEGVAQFFVVVSASVVIGFLVGMVAAFITRFSEHVHVLEPVIVFTMGYISYLLADLFEFSGIVSLIFCAITMRHYVEANISRKSHTTIKYAMKMLSNVSEMIIFLFLGLSLYDTQVQNWDWGLSLLTALFALIYRPIGVIVLTLVVNIFRIKKIGVKSIFIMSYSGLRGAVAFSLALTRIFDEPILLSDDATEDIRNEALLRKTMLTAVTFLVLFTVFIQGITIKPLAKHVIKVRTASDRKPTMNEVIHSTTVDHVMSGLEDILGHFGHNRIREKIIEIDSKYLRKIFERYPEARDEQILHTFTRLQFQESQKAVEQNLVFEYHNSEEGGRASSHISLREAAEYERSALSYDQNEEDAIPTLNDILAASFAHPHEDHYGHVLSTNERDNAEDHHFEPVNIRRERLRAKHKRRKVKQRRRNRISQLMKGSSQYSLSSDRTDKTDEAAADREHEQVNIPLEDLGSIPTHESPIRLDSYSPVISRIPFSPPPPPLDHQESQDFGGIPTSTLESPPVLYKPPEEDPEISVVMKKPLQLLQSKQTDV